MKKPRKKKLKVIKANQILLEDLEGRPRILLEATEGATLGVSITLFSKNHASIQISMNDDNHGVLQIHHADGNVGACLAVKGDGQSGLMLADNNGNPSITLHSKGKDQKPAIEIQTGKGVKQLP